MGIMLQTPRTLTKKTLGDRAFLAAAPKLWNGLPSQMKMLLISFLISGSINVKGKFRCKHMYC